MFTPPDEAKKADSLLPQRRRSEAKALEGQKAPQFKIDLLEGGTFDLSEHLGKHVVGVDFWATWGGPCRKALPIVADVTGDLREQGVVFVAVNQQEGKKKIRSFLENQDISCQVGLDKKGEVGDTYKVQGIPQTVIIGPEGKVRSVHVGFLPDLKKRLTKELKDLTAEMESGSESE